MIHLDLILITKLERVARCYGCHVAVTGSKIYPTLASGRKDDLDLIIYPEDGGLPAIGQSDLQTIAIGAGLRVLFPADYFKREVLICEGPNGRRVDLLALGG